MSAVMGPKLCGCGTPHTASVHAEIVLGRDVEGGTETTSLDLYLCENHDETDCLGWDRLTADGWEILESTWTDLNRQENVS